MRPIFQLTMLLAVLAACNAPTGNEAAATAPAGVGDAATPSGADSYAQHCASCHTDGVDGAPRLGVAEDWEGRSPLWQAVLFEHADAGYLSMPPKGGAADLSQQTVAAAAEYMLEQTFRDRPVD